MTFSGDDIVAAARTLRDFSSAHPTMDIRGGVVDGKPLDAIRVMRIASLPGLEQLRAEAVWSMESPISGLVRVLEGTVSGIVYALQERVDQIKAHAEGA